MFISERLRSLGILVLIVVLGAMMFTGILVNAAPAALGWTEALVCPAGTALQTSRVGIPGKRTGTEMAAHCLSAEGAEVRDAAFPAFLLMWGADMLILGAIVGVWRWTGRRRVVQRP